MCGLFVAVSSWGGETSPGFPGDSETQAAASQAAEAEPAADHSFLRILNAGGTIGFIIILLSVAAVAITIELLITVRAKVLIPPGFAEEIAQKLVSGQRNEAFKQCRENPSVLGTVLAAGLNDSDLGWDAVEKSVEDATAEQAARLYRRVDYLNVIGNIAPMLGLLGTVVGMVIAFQELAESTGYQRAGDLAEGIYLALVTTVEGLIVAIPALCVYAFFNNRVAFLIGETTYIADQVLRPLKRAYYMQQNSKIAPTAAPKATTARREPPGA